MPAEENYIIKKCSFNTETELMEALLIKCLKPCLKVKLGHSRGAVTSARVSLKGAVLKQYKIQL